MRRSHDVCPFRSASSSFPPTRRSATRSSRTSCSELGSVEARVLQRHLWRWRFDAREDARTPCARSPQPASRPRRTCRASARRRTASREILATYRAQNIRRLVALRGDLPSGTATAGEFRYAAELVAFIRETQGSDWHIEVAAYPEYHPQQRYAARDLQHYVGQGEGRAPTRRSRSSSSTRTPTSTSSTRRASWAPTVPVVPGIMPFHNFAKIAQFAARDGIEIPRWVALKMEGFMDDAASIRAFGIDVVTRLCERLIEGGAPGIHFYTMNQSALTLEICQRLGAVPRA